MAILSHHSTAGLVTTVLLLLTVCLPAHAAADAPCQQIRKACAEAGFTKGGAKQGEGINADCLKPILEGTAQPRRANRPLPNVDPSVIAACRAFHAEKPSDGASAMPASPAAAAALASPPAGPRPNIVLILVDDLSLDLVAPATLEAHMPHLAAMMREGVTFENYFVTDSLCCPSRSSIFTGKLPHNTGVFTNTPPLGGLQAFTHHGNESQTFAVALQGVGYRTAMLGKYLNGYKPEHEGAPAGWSGWDVAGHGYGQFNYALNQDGKVMHYGSDKDPRNYLTDVIAGLGENFIRNSAAGPFFIEFATFSPHSPYIPAPRHARNFPGLTYPRNAAFGLKADEGAPNWLKAIAPLTPKDVAEIDKGFRMRVRSTQSIDDLIGRARALIASLHIEHNTYVIFSSDNGYHMGEYSLRPGKMTPFDTDIHVPLVIVGPGIEPGRIVQEITENIDLCPTFTELGGAPTPGGVDGRSLVELLHPSANRTSVEWRRAALVEHRHPGYDDTDPDSPQPHSGNPPSYEALRTARALYVEYEGGAELAFYDLASDPLELRNIAATLAPAERKRWHDALRANATCKGTAACAAAQALVP